jgi:two-component system sensor histidine kinase KdpD
MVPRQGQDAPVKTPEEWLEQATEEKASGIFKVFLGYAPGVGKTYNMLSEALRRKNRGEDVVVGLVETHGRKGVAALADQLEAVPLRPLEYKGTMFQEMDVDAVLARRPQVALVDELAHTNIAGSKHRKRYEDVLELLAAKIDVLSTVNIQHIESLNPTVQSITGIAVRETVPDWVMERADEVVMADLTPEALRTRMQRGDIYPPERTERALSNFFRRGNLLALRELALRQVTRAVDRNLDAYLRRKRFGDNWQVQERVAVCISANSSAQQLIARGARIAEGIDAELYVVHVDDEEMLSPEESRALQANFRFAENLSAQVVHLKGGNIANAVATFVQEKRITQVIIGRKAVQGLRKYLYNFTMQRFLQTVPQVDVHIITQDAR